jgi:hypothetical protein
MSVQPLTNEDLREMFRKTDRQLQKAARRIQEVARQQAETDRQMKAANRRFSDFSSKIGKVIEHMIRGNIVEQFRPFGYDVVEYARNLSFVNNKLSIRGEIDIVLFDGDVVILIEVKTTLEVSDVRRHLERLDEYRRFTDAKPWKSNKRFVGAVAGAVASEDAVRFAHENGLYAIVQSGKAVEIVPPPEWFKAKEW